MDPPPPVRPAWLQLLGVWGCGLSIFAGTCWLPASEGEVAVPPAESCRKGPFSGTAPCCHCRLASCRIPSDRPVPSPPTHLRDRACAGCGTPCLLGAHLLGAASRGCSELALGLQHSFGWVHLQEFGSSLWVSYFSLTGFFHFYPPNIALPDVKITWTWRAFHKIWKVQQMEGKVQFHNDLPS